jgi:hypothetical protein
MLVTLITVLVVRAVTGRRNISIAISNPIRGITVFSRSSDVAIILLVHFTPLSQVYCGRDQKSVQKCSYKTEGNKPTARPRRRWNGKNVKLSLKNAAETNRIMRRRVSHVY